MSFLTKEELQTVIYGYQLEEITEMDDGIVYMAITAAEDEVKSYLRGNALKAFGDGRPRYDADAALAKEGLERNALLLEHTKTIALWYIIRLCNVDAIYDHAKERYDRAIDFLKQVRKGEVTLDIPLLVLSTDGSEGTTAAQPFRFGSRAKFNHDI